MTTYFTERDWFSHWNSLEQCVIDSATVNALKNGLLRTRNHATFPTINDPCVNFCESHLPTRSQMQVRIFQVPQPFMFEDQDYKILSNASATITCCRCRLEFFLPRPIFSYTCSQKWQYPCCQKSQEAKLSLG